MQDGVKAGEPQVPPGREHPNSEPGETSQGDPTGGQKLQGRNEVI